jgi:S-formylglutathione hydrolase FrmB
MGSAAWIVAFFMDVVGVGQAPSCLLGPHQLDRVNHRLHGQLLDFTHNHGHDNRLWYPSLHQKRDLYVYLPPGFDPHKHYPLVIFLHGAGQDEQFFLQALVERYDHAITVGKLPPVIIAAPDGSSTGRPSVRSPATFWTNSRAGNFEDYVMCDMWNFMMENFPIRPEREAHALVGASMGGSAAFALAIKHRDRVKVAIGFHALLNLRYVDCHGHYRTQFRPECWGFREEFHGHEALGRRRFITLRFGQLFRPLFGDGPEAIENMSHINPIELMEQCNLQPGELDLFVAYGGKDEFNVPAQVESFLYRARERGIEVGIAYDPHGRHDRATSLRLMPLVQPWAAARFAAVGD